MRNINKSVNHTRMLVRVTKAESEKEARREADLSVATRESVLANVEGEIVEKYEHVISESQGLHNWTYWVKGNKEAQSSAYWRE